MVPHSPNLSFELGIAQNGTRTNLCDEDRIRSKPYPRSNRGPDLLRTLRSNRKSMRTISSVSCYLGGNRPNGSNGLERGTIDVTAYSAYNIQTNHRRLLSNDWSKPH